MKYKLGEICSFQSGGTPSKTNAAYFSGDIPWITTVALNGQVIGKQAAVDWITKKAIAESAAKIVPARSIMIGTRVGVGKVAINESPMSTSQDIISLVGIDESLWSKEFLCRFIQAKESYLKSQARGATIKGIKIDVLASLDLPDVSIDSQQEIVAVLDKIQNILAARRSQLSALDDLIKARFVEMFGDTILNPFGWEKDLLGIVCDVRDGTHDSPQYHEMGFPLITSKNVTGGKIDLTDCSLISEEDFKKINERSKVDVGDIIMPMIGTVGKPVIVDIEPDFAIKNVSLIKFRHRTRVLNKYIRALLQSDYFDDAVLSKVRGGTQKFVSLGDIRNLEILVPPIEKQKQFADFVLQIDKSKSVIQKSLDETQRLFDSLMQQYFG